MAQQIDHGEWKPLWKPAKTEKKKPTYIKQSGKVSQTWAKVKIQYLKDHPPAHEGWWICGICGGRVYKGDEDVDHIINRSLRPDLRYEYSNLQICHSLCNGQKKTGGH